MKKSVLSYRIYIFLAVFSLLILMGCSGENANLTDNQSAKEQMPEMQISEESLQTEEPSKEMIPRPIETDAMANETQEEEKESVIIEADYADETINQLKQVMLLVKQNETDITIYGKTGMGVAHGAVIDAWFTGFADKADKRITFCVYLGENENNDVSSARAREIAIKIVSDYLG